MIGDFMVTSINRGNVRERECFTSLVFNYSSFLVKCFFFYLISSSSGEKSSVTPGILASGGYEEPVLRNVIQ